MEGEGKVPGASGCFGGRKRPEIERGGEGKKEKYNK